MEKTDKERIDLDTVVLRFTQDEHCCSNDMGGVESLTIECMSSLGITRDKGAYFVLKTEQWAIDGVEDLEILFKKIKKSIEILL